MAVRDFNTWKNGALGRHIDADGAYGAQCVDVALDYTMYLTPDHGWQETLGFGNAKDLFVAANDAFFEKIVNDHNDPNQLPNQGDIIIYDQIPGDPYGHVAVVDSADAGGANVIEQNGFHPEGVCYAQYRVWGRMPCIGWLRPRDLSPTPAPTPVPVEVPVPVVEVPVIVPAPVVTPDPVVAPAPEPIPAVITTPSAPVVVTAPVITPEPTPQVMDTPKDSLLTTIIKFIVSLALKIWNADLKKG